MRVDAFRKQAYAESSPPIPRVEHDVPLSRRKAAAARPGPGLRPRGAREIKSAGMTGAVWFKREELARLEPEISGASALASPPKSEPSDRHEGNSRPTMDAAHERRVRLLVARSRKIATFKKRMDQSKDWIAIRDIMDWWSRVPDNPEPVPARQAHTFRQLQDAFVNGEFNVGGKSWVLCLHPYPWCLWGRLTTHRLDIARASGKSGEMELLIEC